MLEIKNLHAGYNGMEILKGFSMRIKTGEIVALIGPNGAGKSTVIRSIFGIADVTGGHVLYKGKNLLEMKPYELIREGICYINQGRIVFDNLTIQENMVIGRQEKEHSEESLKKIYERFPELGERKHEYAFGLSGGQRQMLAIGRALMQKPSLLLLDEPSLGLSPKMQNEIFSIIKKMKNEGISVLIVEQNAKKAIETADRTYLLEDGIVALEGSGKKILRDKKIREVYLGNSLQHYMLFPEPL